MPPFAAAIIIDNGSGMIRAGCSSEDAPKVAFVSAVGYPKQKGSTVRDYCAPHVNAARTRRAYRARLRYPPHPRARSRRRGSHAEARPSASQVPVGARHRAKLGRHGEGEGGSLGRSSPSLPLGHCPAATACAGARCHSSAKAPPAPSRRPGDTPSTTSSAW